MDMMTTDTAAPAPVNDTSVPVAEAATEAAKPSPEDELGAIWDKHYPPRDAGGKFKAVEAPPADAAVKEAPPADTTSTDQPAKTAPEPASPAIDAPNSWSAEAKAKWASVPPEVREYIAKRETEAHQAITRMGEQIKTTEPVRAVFERHADTLKRIALPAHDAVDRLLAVESYLQQDPRGAIREIARAYGVEDVFGGVQPENVASQEITRLLQHIAQLETRLTSREAQERDAAQAETARQIADFSKTRPHFEAVRTIMAGLIQTGAAPDMAAAYDMAVQAHPETRAKIAEEAKREAEAKAKAEAEKKAAEARKHAAINPKGAPGNSPAAPRTMRAGLEEVADRLGLR